MFSSQDLLIFVALLMTSAKASLLRNGAHEETNRKLASKMSLCHVDTTTGNVNLITVTASQYRSHIANHPQDFDPKTFFPDNDRDGFGNPNSSIQACTAPQGYVEDNTDCDDNNALVYPGAGCVCAQSIFYLDNDGDGYGDPNSSISGCTAPPGSVRDNTDCNDNNPLINPGAPEICKNGVDDNCDGRIDERRSCINA